MMVKLGAIAVLILNSALAAYTWTPQSAETLFEADIDLSPGNTTTENAADAENLSLLPEIQELSDRVTAHIDEIDERILVESVRQLQVDDERRLEPEDEAHLVGTILRAVSSMEGIEYYSERRGRYRTLFERSTRIDDPESRESVDDPTPDQIPERDQIYVLQEDGTFGENVYRFEYETLDAGMLLVMTNETRLSWGILPTVGAEKLRMVFAAIPTNEGILFYGLAGVDIPTILGMGDRISVSFQNRVNALSEWFERELEDALR